MGTDEWLQFLTASPLTVAPRLTAVFFLAFPPWQQGRIEFAPLSAGDLASRAYRLLLVGALLTDVVSSPFLWISIAIAHFTWVVKAYAVADNHRYLEGYWAIALALALLHDGAAGEALIVRNSLVLIGLPFAVAVARKLMSPRFRNGDFFLLSLLSDARFGMMAHALGGMPKGGGAPLAAIQKVRSGDAQRVQVDIPPRLKHVATFLTWWTLAIEIVLAIVFLIPAAALQPWQLLPLLVFAVSTFGLVPVQTFSNILLLMLAVSSDSEFVRGLTLATLALMTFATGIGATLAQTYSQRARGRQLPLTTVRSIVAPAVPR